MKQSFSLCASAVLAFVMSILQGAFGAAYAQTDAENGPCGSVWRPYVERIGAILREKKEPAPPILFVSRDGEVFDCFDIGYSQQRLESFALSQNLFQKLFPQWDREKEINPDDEVWPDNVCAVMVPIRLHEDGYVAVHLPVDGQVLDTQRCAQNVFMPIQDSFWETANRIAQ